MIRGIVADLGGPPPATNASDSSGPADGRIPARGSRGSFTVVRSRRISSARCEIRRQSGAEQVGWADMAWWNLTQGAGGAWKGAGTWGKWVVDVGGFGAWLLASLPGSLDYPLVCPLPLQATWGMRAVGPRDLWQWT
jgi:hypothetical protein